MISVVIVNYNKKDLLSRCLDSLRQQTFKDFEVIVVDNGSNDGSRDNVQNYYKEARLICLNENRGFSAGNNVGIANAKYEYVALLNNDMEAHPQWLERMHIALSRNPGIGFFASRILKYSDRDIIDAAGDIFYTFGIGAKCGNGHRSTGGFNVDREVFGACAGAVLYTKSMLNKIGFFDEIFSPAYYEDIDLSFRAQLQGYRCLYVSQAVVYHHGHAAISYFSPKHTYLCSRNSGYVLIKNMPTSLLLRYGIAISLYNILSFFGHVIRSRGISFLSGKIAILKNLSYLYRQRRIIQKQRSVSDKYIKSILTHEHFHHFFIRGCRNILRLKIIKAN